MTHDPHPKRGDEITISPSTNLTELIDGFKREHGIHRVIAFSGGSDDKPEGITDKSLEEALVAVMQQKEQDIISQAVQRLQGYRIAILCGGTVWGVPQTATRQAKHFGLTTIGVYPFAGRKHALGPDELDLRICIEPDFGISRWGDESDIYAKLLDGVIVYGGSAGTLVEVAHILKMNEAILKEGGVPKYIVPISGTGGVADGLPFIWSKTHVRAISMPITRVTSGREAAEILIDRLNLDDFFEL